MSALKSVRDYRVTGPEYQLAQERALAMAEWYESPIPRQRMKELMRRKNGPGIRDVIIWVSLLGLTGTLAWFSWGSWWAIPAFFIYAQIYATMADAMWHETSHGTAFKSDWLNELMYHISSFMTLKPATSARWSHTNHHTDTFIVGRDPEIRPRPPVWMTMIIELLKLNEGPRDFKRNLLHALGQLTEVEKVYVPKAKQHIVFWEARIRMLILLGVALWCISIESILPALFIGLPTFYGFATIVLITLPQHLGLSEDVLDHRLNTRTYYLNPFLRFLYMNMNYHIEHHMFPMVPYHALPALHEEMKKDCPRANSSLWEALKEVVVALRRQRNDVNYSLVRPLPETARSYNFGPQAQQVTL
jgi:fatty acid desaturase